ncbi:MAG: polyphosphate kinase 1 [Acidobacteriota bacterium]
MPAKSTRESKPSRNAAATKTASKSADDKSDAKPGTDDNANAGQDLDSTSKAGASKPTPDLDDSSPAHADRADESTLPDLDDSSLFINRELSWLEFNRRVLEEALDDSNPLLERVKFLSIFSSNLDEFYMIRVAGLRRQLATGVLTAPPDGMSPAEQLAGIREQLKPMLESTAQCWKADLMPKLKEAGIEILAYSDLKRKQRQLLRRHFKREIFPALTPLAFDPGHPFPHISNLSINLAVVINHPSGEERFARLKVPPVFPRLLRIPTEEKAEEYEQLGLSELRSDRHFVWLEEVIAANLDLLFHDIEVAAAYPFRVTRDADFEIEEDEVSDLLEAMEEVVGQRHFGFAVRLEVDDRMPDRIRDILISNLKLKLYQTNSVDGPIGMADIFQLYQLDRPELKDAPFLPYVPSALAGEEKSIFSLLQRRSVLLYHPYDSFNPVVDFIREAANDPDVLTIKQTLYRVGPDSPIVKALMEARENGKQVAVMVELKARFDETNNIVWARALERAGVHVAYGLLGLKTHAKMSLVVRREKSGITRYVHLGTGNYNPVTARIYTDLGYFSCETKLATDVSDLFNALTGYSHKETYRKLLVAPASMRQEILRRIDREIDCHRKHGNGHLAFKLNSLADKACIQALYRASRAGVKVELQVRGICCLRPGVPEVSENITVTSIVGRFLEHSRIFYFHNGGDEELLSGSADLMPRNLGGRVETLFPIDDVEIREAVRDDILFAHLRDTHGARRLRSDGSFESLRPADGPGLDTQQLMLEHRRSWRRKRPKKSD